MIQGGVVRLAEPSDFPGRPAWVGAAAGEDGDD